MQNIKTKIRRLFSRTTGDSSRHLQGVSAGRRLGIESLESRQMLDAAGWTAAVVGDEADAFFDDSYVHDIYITFEDADWYTTLYDSHANDVTDPYFEADFTADGVTIDNVGVRFKGNSSFNGNTVKKSIKIDFDEFDDANVDPNFFGLTKLNLNNNHNDPSQMREKLFLDYASNFVEGVSRAVHTNVHINGQLWGLYTAVEQIDKNFVQSRFGSDEDGNLYKGAASDDAGDDPQDDFGSDLTYLGSDLTLYDEYYQLKTNETAYDYSGLVEFIDVLNNTPAASLPAAIEPLLDVEDALAGMALNNLFSNLDSYSGAAHNYYLYDRDDTGQFTHIPWDANESFGTFSQFVARGQDMAELDPFWVPVANGPPGSSGEEERPLMENLWDVEEYSEAYLRDLAEMLRCGFDATSATTRINELANLIRADVTADPNKQFTTAQFETNLTSDVSNGRTVLGLTSFIGERAAYLESALAAYATTTDLKINELMSVNLATAQDEAGDSDPWVEIYNFGPSTVGMNGLYLTDDASNLTQWAIPSTNLDDGDFLTIWIDGETGEGSHHANFSLNSLGGSLLLTDGVSVIDSTTYGAMDGDTAFARVPDGDGDFEVTDQPTFGAENLASALVIEPVDLVINEFMAVNDTTIQDPEEVGAYDDWIELYNPGSEPIDLGGMYLTDDLTDATQWQFTAGTTIAAGGYLIIWADNDDEQGPTHASFKLSSSGEQIGLYHIDGATLIDSVEFGTQTADVSAGRSPNGSGEFVSMPTPTPGTANITGTYGPGDYNTDGTVDQDDYTLWISTFNSTTDLRADGNGNNIVDAADFTVWRDNLDPVLTDATPAPITRSVESDTAPVATDSSETETEAEATEVTEVTEVAEVAEATEVTEVAEVAEATEVTESSEPLDEEEPIESVSSTTDAGDAVRPFRRVPRSAEPGGRVWIGASNTHRTLAVTPDPHCPENHDDPRIDATDAVELSDNIDATRSVIISRAPDEWALAQHAVTEAAFADLASEPTEIPLQRQAPVEGLPVDEVGDPIQQVRPRRFRRSAGQRGENRSVSGAARGDRLQTAEESLAAASNENW